MSNHDPILLSRRATMQLLRVSDATFNRMIADGVVPPGIPCGKRTRWNRAALIAHLNRRAAEATISNAA